MTIPILAWARTPVAPVGGALSACQPHDLAAPLVARLLADSGLPPEAVDAVVLGNALGAGGNPARLLALAAGLPERVPAITLDSQCCAGLDAITHACGLLALGQAQVVIAGGAEAWSRAPLRMRRPAQAGAEPQPYEQPAFTPWPERDPDMLQAALDGAQRLGLSRAAQDAYAQASHARAVAARAAMAAEIVPLAGLAHDAYPRSLSAERVARMPAVAVGRAAGGRDCRDCSLSTVAVSPKADGAALLLLATSAACERLGLRPRAHWCGNASVGGAPESPMLCAIAAARAAQARSGWQLEGLDALELHDAFAAQGLAFCDALGLAPEAINRGGGGLARGHPIGASGAIALVRVLAQLGARAGARAQRGIACIAGAGGLGTATWVEVGACG